MAATGYSPIQLYYSTTASTAPTAGNLASGELAINITDGKLYYKDNAGAVQLLSTSTTANGTANGVLYLNGSKVATAGTALTFDGTNLGIGGAAALGKVNSFISANTRASTAFGASSSTTSGYFFVGQLSGTTTSDFFAYSDASSTQIGSEANKPLAFYTNNTEAMRLNSTGLGIGTSSPGVKLDVVGQGRVIYNTSATNTGDQSAVVVGATTSGAYASSYGAGLQFQITNNSGGYAGSRIVSRLGADNNTANLVFQARNYGWTDSMTLDTSGNLGIGTSSPGYKLDVIGTIHAYNASGANAIILENGANAGVYARWKRPNREYYLALDINNNGGTDFSLYDATAGATRWTVDSSGNLGLGVTPSGWTSIKALQVVNASFGGIGGGNYSAANAYYDGTNWKYITSNYATLYQQSGNAGDGVHKWYIAASGTAGNAITFTQAMTLDASGNWVIGATSAGYTTSGRIVGYINGTSSSLLGFGIGGAQAGYVGAFSSGLEIAAEGAKVLMFTTNAAERARIDSSGNLLVGTTDTSGANTTGFEFFYGSGSSRLYVGHVTGTVTGTYYQAFNYAGTTIGSITQSGTTAVLYNVTSDQRLKENIVDAPEFGSVIDSIKVRSYDWKSDGNHQRAGFVAQELVTVAPEAVHQPADPEEMMAVDYSKLVPMLVKEIQSLRKRLADAGIA